MSIKGKDLTGEQFTRWTVLWEAEPYISPSGYKIRKWHCRCICGQEKDVLQVALVTGDSKSCGCLQKDEQKESRMDLTGQRYNRWTVIEEAPPMIDSNGYPRRMWWAKCDCGTKRIVSQASLRSGASKSCGCLKNEVAAELGRNSKKYNQYDLSNEYGIGYTFKGETFYFDKEDYDLIYPYCWMRQSNDGYIIAHNANDDGKWVLMHRLVMNLTDDSLYIDHRNHQKADNRKCNLRIVTPSLNGMNAKPSALNTSGHRGVSFETRSGKWIANIRVNGKIKYLGKFADVEDAIAIRIQAENRYYGKYSYTNSIEDSKQYEIKEEKDNGNTIQN